MAEPVQYSILPNNGSGWCWEIIAKDLQDGAPTERRVVSTNSEVYRAKTLEFGVLKRRLIPQSSRSL